ncbi:hypothetical protein HGRIS_006466 [Hohenbuehelia grisea]|uniref:Uncharacterized protein n=1 Tax=Hohenbuehelia grisea TaxID=104357 RepID=A0ABR3K0A3_9AGAR
MWRIIMNSIKCIVKLTSASKSYSQTPQRHVRRATFLDHGCGLCPIRWIPEAYARPEWLTALNIYLENGAKFRVGEIDTVEILHRADKGPSPVHLSAYNPNDTRPCISLRIYPKNGQARTHHLFINGTGTMNAGDTAR